jgi:hypothetical protein
MSASQLFSTELMLRVYSKLRRTFGRRGKYVFLATMPKSGSTFFGRVLVELTGFERVYLASAYLNLEEELYLPRVIDQLNRGTVTQQHVRANRVNIEMMKRFEIRPVVIVRNLDDILISLREHLLREKIDSMPGFYPSENFVDLDEATQHDFLIDYVMPWYMGFYASWWSVAQSGELDVLWLRYEDLIKDWADGITQALDFYGLDASPTRISSAIETVQEGSRKKSRINVGRAGRGGAILTDAQRERARALTRFYPDVDFSSIGW